MKLIERDGSGHWNLKGIAWKELREGQIITRDMAEKLYGALYKLMRYENTKQSPDEIEEMYDSLRERQWIPTEMRLPETEEFVLVQVSGRPSNNITLHNAFEIAEYAPDEGWILEMYPEWEDAEIAAWMPLPEPYREEKI